MPKDNPWIKQEGGSHYKDLAIQPAEYCQRNRLGYCESSVVKYVTRHRSKNGKQDIEKAIHFLQLLLTIEYPDSPPQPLPPVKVPWYAKLLGVFGIEKSSAMVLPNNPIPPSPKP